jgi:hypothetical protein
MQGHSSLRRMPQALLLSVLAMACPPLSAGQPSQSSPSLCSDTGLQVSRRQRRGSHYFAMSASTQVEVRFRGRKLCGTDIDALLHPDGDEPSRARMWCPVAAQALPGQGALVFFSSASAPGPVLAHLCARDGALVATRIDAATIDTANEARTDTPTSPDRNRFYSPRLLDARMPGWTRVETAWYDTILIAHSPLRIVRLGQGRLLDIEHGIAWLIVDIDKVSPDMAARDRRAHVRAVSLDDGRSVASLALPGCAGIPPMQLDGNDAVAVPRTSGRLAFNDVAPWRRQHLRLHQDPYPHIEWLGDDDGCRATDDK